MLRSAYGPRPLSAADELVLDKQVEAGGACRSLMLAAALLAGLALPCLLRPLAMLAAYSAG